jgi:uncharacterized protein YihD (DUF1040 family)
MVFSNEEKQIWAKSEVMRELERIAVDEGIEVPIESYMPISEDKGWEEESDENKLESALSEFETSEPKELDEEIEELISIMEKDSTLILVDGLKKLASYLGENGNLLAANRVEDALFDVKIAIKEAANG